MQRPLSEHIADLEQRVQYLKSQAGDLGRTADERYQSSVDLRIAQRALLHYRTAYDLEQEISHNKGELKA